MAGVDGCRGGWVAAVVEDRALVGWRFATSAAAIVRSGERICLPERGRRSLERTVRALLPGRACTVFPTPVRAVLAEAPPHGSYAAACAVSRERCGGLAISRQTWLITDKIADMDAALAVDPALDAVVAEAHPELAFATMNGAVPLRSKRSADGAAVRRRLLADWLGSGERALEDRLGEPAGTARADDKLDALACAWVAARWAAGLATVHADPAAPTDATGRPMRIVC